MVEVKDPVLSFDEAKHEYRIDGQVVPSVTEIIAPLSDHSRVPAETLEFKRSLGKAVHKAIELYEGADGLDMESLDLQALPYFEGWLKFKRESRFQAEIVERPYGSAKLRFAGTPDVIGSRTECFDELLDVKCTYAMEPATGVQLAGYEILLEENGIKIKRRGGVQLMPDGTFRYHEFKSRNDRIVFLSCLNLFNWKRNCK